MERIAGVMIFIQMKYFVKTFLVSIFALPSIISRNGDVRSRQDDITLTLTARALKTIIRLASAHARVSFDLSIN